MQNHGGYEKNYDNFISEEDLSDYGDFPQAETYLGLIRESDQALENSFYEYLYGKPLDSLTPQELQKK